jgi:hypothetical protein
MVLVLRNKRHGVGEILYGGASVVNKKGLPVAASPDNPQSLAD